MLKIGKSKMVKLAERGIEVCFTGSQILPIDDGAASVMTNERFRLK